MIANWCHVASLMSIGGCRLASLARKVIYAPNPIAGWSSPLSELQWCLVCTCAQCTCAMFTVPFVQYIIVSTLQPDLLLCEAEIFVHCAETRRGLQLFSSFTGILEKLQLSTALPCKILKLQNTWMETERVQANVTSANRVFKRQWKSAPRQHMGPLWELNGSMEQAHIVNWGTACAGTSPPTK